jgi:hypothetical protein
MLPIVIPPAIMIAKAAAAATAGVVVGGVSSLVVVGAALKIGDSACEAISSKTKSFAMKLRKKTEEKRLEKAKMAAYKKALQGEVCGVEAPATERHSKWGWFKNITRKTRVIKTNQQSIPVAG